MAKKDEIDIEEEVKRISRKSNINMGKSEYSFEKQIKRLDKEMDKILDFHVREFDEIKQLTQDYLNIDFEDATIKRYREKLRKM